MTDPAHRTDFARGDSLIREARGRALAPENSALMDLSWRVGGHISRRIAGAEWGEGVADERAAHIPREHPDRRGFDRRHLHRMRPFHETSPRL
jgi:hypothetical protein